jgi:caa(3)-type oxidase subunit IV
MAKDDAKAKGKKADEKKAEPEEKASAKKAADTKDAPKKAADTKDAPKKAEPKAEPKAAAKEAHGDHGHGDHGHGAHGHKVDRKEYWKIFVVLFVLTVLEVGVAQIPGIAKSLLYIALIGLAVTKAACVGLFYMHLKHETKYLKLTVALPFAAPTVYALVLIVEGAWRATRG